MKNILSILACVLAVTAFADPQGDYLNERPLHARVTQRVLGDGYPLNVNIGNLPRLNYDLANNLPLDIWFMGDDAINPTTHFNTAIDLYLTRNGSATGNGALPYLGWSSGSITEPSGWSGANDPWPYYYLMANASALTNRYTSDNGISTSDVTLYFWKSNGYGTLTIRTQSLVAGVLGTAGTLTTVDASADNAGLPAVPAVTNISIAVQPNLTASVYSSGQNLIYSIGQRNTNVGSGYIYSGLVGGNFDINLMMTNAPRSNTLRTFLSAWPPSLVILHDKNTSNSLYSGSVKFHDMLTNASLTTDVAMMTEVPSLFDEATSATERDAILRVARETGRAALDTYSYFVPFDQNRYVTSYRADGVHLSNNVARAVSGLAVGWLKLRASDVLSYRYPTVNTVTNLTASSITAPGGGAGIGTITISNSVYSGFSGTRKQIADNSGLVSALTAGGQWLRPYNGNNAHGYGVAQIDGVAASYLVSDGSVIIGYMSGGAASTRVRFDVANSMTYSAGSLWSTNGFITSIATVTLAADNQVVGITTNATFFVASDNATAANRTFVLTTGVPGKIVRLIWSGTNQGELVDDSANSGAGNVRLSAVWPTAATAQYDTLTLIGVGNDWYEIGRSGN